MKIAFEVDARLILVTAVCGVVGLFALHSAYPGLYDYWPKTSADLASWMQAAGALVALGIAIYLPQKQSADVRRANASLIHSFAVYQLGILAAASKSVQSKGMVDVASGMALHIKSLEQISSGITPTLVLADSMPVLAGLLSLKNEIAECVNQANAKLITSSDFQQSIQHFSDEAYRLLQLTRERIGGG